ncbi:MAG: alpha-amylase [Trueperaceae bacterium]
MSELNGVMMQYFHWYLPNDGSLWNQVKEGVPDLAERGITSLWLPPTYKGAGGGYDTGYGVYDLFDLGEFDQKGSVRTKYGTKAEFVAAVAAAKEVGIRIYADAVFNHKMGADAEEEADAKPFNPDNRNEAVGDYQKIKAWTHFKFPGRAGKYSTMEWHWYHFTAIDHNMNDKSKRAIYVFKDKGFDNEVDLEKGNFDYLMGCDLDMEHPEVSGELTYWGEWFVKETGVDGFRFDAVKHVKAEFFKNWLAGVEAKVGKDLFAVGEYWSYQLGALDYFIATTQGKITLFDAPLHLNFHLASKAGNSYDMRKIFDGSLVQQNPQLAVTIVENHDTQPLQSLESPVDSWFKPLAYALILLRREGYPCIFYADYYGATYKDKGKDGNDYDIMIDSQKFLLDKFLHARRCYAYGDQYDYFDHGNCIGWTRQGNDEHKGGMAVLLSNGDAGTKRMQARPNQTYIDCTEHLQETITTDNEGWGEFKCKAGSVSVWVPIQ